VDGNTSEPLNERGFAYPKLDEVTKLRGDRLPHWRNSDSVYHVVYRLADSLPAKVVREWRIERDALVKRKFASEADRDRLKQLSSTKIDSALDRAHGECLMSNPKVAEIVHAGILHFNEERYRLHASAVMPNHVHLVIQPFGENSLSSVVHSMKSYSAHQINKLLGKSGRVWQQEYFDHLIRSEASYLRSIQYVCENPIKAGLDNWPWVYQIDLR
jgi:REP element-mobilizing transposase RayT